MPTDANPHDEIRRLAAARDEALQRYTRHLAAIKIRNSRWSLLLSHGRATLRGRPAAPLGAVNPISHAH